MTRRLDQLQLAARNEIVEAPAARSFSDHHFEMPAGIYGAMALMFGGAVAILAMAFRSDMIVTYGIVVAFLVAFFAVPVIIVKASPADSSRAMEWSRFRELGIRTATGHAGALEASVLALLLPFMVLCWAVAIVVIAALVG